jgi:hypothetical protein
MKYIKENIPIRLLILLLLTTPIFAKQQRTSLVKGNKKN